MEIISYIIPPLVGAVIGYLTNYFAIRMIFFPKKKLYIWKIPIPFTPGIIPKRRKEVARNIL